MLIFGLIIVILYEDLIENTYDSLNLIFHTLDMEISDEVLLKAVKNQSFTKKKKEFLSKKDYINANFMRSGKKNSWKDLLSEDLLIAINEKHSVTMKKYGYLE